MGGGCLTPRLNCCTLGKRLCNLCIGGWMGSRADLDGVENLVPTGIRFPHHQDRSECLRNIKPKNELLLINYQSVKAVHLIFSITLISYYTTPIFLKYKVVQI